MFNIRSKVKCIICKHFDSSLEFAIWMSDIYERVDDLRQKFIKFIIKQVGGHYQANIYYGDINKLL